MEVKTILEKYPGYVPVIVDTKSTDLKLSKRKYLVVGEITLGQFLVAVKQRITDLDPTHGLFLFVNNILPTISTPMSLIYKEHKDPNTQMLHMTICKENTFG